MHKLGEELTTLWKMYAAVSAAAINVHNALSPQEFLPGCSLDSTPTSSPSPQRHCTILHSATTDQFCPFSFLQTNCPTGTLGSDFFHSTQCLWYSALPLGIAAVCYMFVAEGYFIVCWMAQSVYLFSWWWTGRLLVVWTIVNETVRSILCKSFPGDLVSVL